MSHIIFITAHASYSKLGYGSGYWDLRLFRNFDKKVIMIDKFLSRRVERQILLLYVVNNYYWLLYGYDIYILLQNSLIYTEMISNKITDEMIFTIKLFCWIVSFGTCWLVSSWLILCVFDIVKWVFSASDLFLRPFPFLGGFVHEPYALFRL